LKGAGCQQRAGHFFNDKKGTWETLSMSSQLLEIQMHIDSDFSLGNTLIANKSVEQI
jgi:hypothetical protein